MAFLFWLAATIILIVLLGIIWSINAYLSFKRLIKNARAKGLKVYQYPYSWWGAAIIDQFKKS